MHAAVGAAIVFVACSSGAEDTITEPPPSVTQESATTDDTTTTAATAPTESDATDGDATDTDATESDATDTDVSDAASAISFASDVQPILESNCASCHSAGGPGAAHLVMETAGDITEFDSQYIDAVIDVGYMPPWPAADGDVDFHGDRRMDTSDIETIAAWADAGGELDVPDETPIVPARTNRPEIDRDLVLQAEPYRGQPDDRDDYRCQIYDPGITEPTWVQGYSIEPDRTEVVHHAVMFVGDAEARVFADEVLEPQDDLPGWNCPGLSNIPVGEVNQILSWAPGQDPTELPSDTGLPMEEGDFFVVQFHMHYEPETADLPPDQSTLVVDIADDDVLAENGGTLSPIDLTLYLGPAEIPCSTEETGPLCDRDAALAELEQGSSYTGYDIASILVEQCGQRVEDFADMTTGIATSTCDLPATPGEIVSIWGHMHEIGKSIKLTLNPDTADERVLLDIPIWDFDWQLDYQPVEDIVLDSDDVIRVECEWDRSKIDEDLEPRYVMWAEGTNDEMCYSQIVTRPV